MKMRVTVRGESGQVELRGFVEEAVLPDFAEDVKPLLVIASPMEGDVNDGQPSMELSQSLIVDRITSTGSVEEAVMMVAQIHYMQAMVIRGERDEREELVRTMHERELHHFEIEQENARLEHDNARLQEALDRERKAHESTLHASQAYMQERDKLLATVERLKARA